jgi:cell division protein FtsB
MQAVAERQQIETLSRDYKARTRNLASLKDKMDQLEVQMNKLKDDKELVGKHKSTVSVFMLS